MASYIKCIQTIKINSLTTYFKTKILPLKVKIHMSMISCQNFQLDLTGNEAGIFILLKGCNVEKQATPNAKKWHPTLINSLKPALSIAMVRLIVDQLIKANTQRCHDEAQRFIRYQKSQFMFFGKSRVVSQLKLVLLLQVLV